MRFLLSFLSMRREDVEDSKFSIVEIIDAAEHDSEEVRRPFPAVFVLLVKTRQKPIALSFF